MEDVEIERGICASRIRCYTEGAMQRPAAGPTGRAHRAGREALHKSASSLHFAKPATGEPSSASQRELCKSCDQLPQGGIARTFVSSVNIALAKPEVARKMSLPLQTPAVHPQSDLPGLKRSSSSSLPSFLDCSSGSNGGDSTKGSSGGHLDRTGLPWDMSDDFPHIPVLERIKEFEKQTGALNCQSSSPGRRKRKGKTHRNKPSGSAHSSLAMSRRGSLDDKVTLRNSRNSSPTILYLHTEMPSAEECSKSTAEGEASDKDSPKIVTTSNMMASKVKTATAFPEAVSCKQEAVSKVLDDRTDSVLKLGESRAPSETRMEASISVSADLQSGSGVVDSSNAISAEACSQQQRAHASPQSSTCPEQLLVNSNSKESTPEVPCDPDKTQSKHICHSSSSNKTEDITVNMTTAQLRPPDINIAGIDTNTDTCIRSEPAFVGNANIHKSIDQELKDRHESSVPAEARVSKPSSEGTHDEIFVQGETLDSSTKREISEVTVDVTSASEDASGKLLHDASLDCRSATGVLKLDSSSEVEARSVRETLNIQCNIHVPVANLPECVTAPTSHCQPDGSIEEEPLPTQPLIDEIFQAGQSMDTDVYSQRCSQQLGEIGSEAAAIQRASAGEDPAPGLLHDGSSPCLSDCYSRSNSSSDDESQTADGKTFSDLLPKADIDRSIKLSSECTVCSTRTGIPPLTDTSNNNANAEEFVDPVALHEANTDEMDKEDPPRQSEKCGSSNALSATSEKLQESIDADSDHCTDDSPPSMSDREASEPLSCIREVLASHQLADLSSSLGACGGMPPTGTGAASENGAAFTSADRSAFSRHLSALIGGQRQLQVTGAGESGDSPLNADQALFLSRVNLILGWIHNQQSQPSPLSIQAALPSSNEIRSPPDVPSDVVTSSYSASSADRSSSSAPVRKENNSLAEQSQPVVQQTESRAPQIKLPKRSKRRKKFINPDKVSHLRYLILQSPLVLSDGEESDSDESDVELNEFGEVKQDYPLGRLPDYIVAQIFSNLGTRDLAALKCSCKDFKWLIERFDIKSTDSRWSESSHYREDPCMQCGKIRDPRGDVSLCRWHPKIYYKNGEIGRHYWTCCFAGEEDAQGCETSLHDNKWSGSHSRLCKVPRSWRQYWRSYPMDS